MGPFKCPDCGIWWARFEHRCVPVMTATGTVPWIVSAPIAMGGPKVCTCPKDPYYVGDNLCPVHSLVWS